VASEFQFLGRNSGRSDSANDAAAVRRRLGFNSSVGILVVRTWVDRSGARWLKSFNSSVGILVVRTGDRAGLGARGAIVSIPRSEFWSFGRGATISSCVSKRRFQFLGRNSGRSDPDELAVARSLRGFQFLGRNSGRSDTLGNLFVVYSVIEFQFLGRNSGRSDMSGEGQIAPLHKSFNSSVGILVVRTRGIIQDWRGNRRVSIPRSEFWSFGRQRTSFPAHCFVVVSIPRSEFWSFGLCCLFSI